MQLTQLRRYEAFLDGTPLLEADGRRLQAWLEHLMGEGYNANSVVLYLGMVRSFYAWSWSKGLISGDRLLEIRATRKPNGAKVSTPRPYSTKELAQFWLDLDAKYPLVGDNFFTPMRLSHLRRGTARFAAIRSHVMRLQIEAVVLIAVCCGLRREEIFRLTVDDLHPDNAYLPVLGKGDKEREVPYTELARAAVVAWLDFRSDILCIAPDRPEPWIKAWGKDYSQRMTLDAFGHQMEKIGDGYELHRFRHSAATNWLREGMPLEILQRLLGHSSLDMTLRYAQLNREDIFRQVEQHEEGFTKRLGLPAEREGEAA